MKKCTECTGNNETWRCRSLPPGSCQVLRHLFAPHPPHLLFPAALITEGQGPLNSKSLECRARGDTTQTEGQNSALQRSYQPSKRRMGPGNGCRKKTLRWQLPGSPGPSCQVVLPGAPQTLHEPTVDPASHRSCFQLGSVSGD